MSTLAFLAYTKKDGTIKSVKLLQDGCLDEVGFNLIEYFTTLDDVKPLITTTIDKIDEDEYDRQEDELLIKLEKIRLDKQNQ